MIRPVTVTAMSLKLYFTASSENALAHHESLSEVYLQWSVIQVNSVNLIRLLIFLKTIVYTLTKLTCIMY